VPDADAWARSELVIANGDHVSPDLVLGPWEARVYRRTV